MSVEKLLESDNLKQSFGVAFPGFVDVFKATTQAKIATIFRKHTYLKGGS